MPRDRFDVNIGWSYDLVASDNTPLPEPGLTKVSVAIYHH